MPLISELLTTNKVLIQEPDVRTTCPTCQRDQSMDSTTVDQSDPLETIYVCQDGCGPILIVSTRGVVEWKGRGYRMGDWMIRNPSDLRAQPPGALATVVIPASPHALD